MAESYTVDGPTDTKLCSKCNERKRRKDHEWCDECKAEKQRQYVKDRDDMMERRGWVAGAEAMRAELLSRMRGAHPAGMLRVAEVCTFLSEVPAPPRG